MDSDYARFTTATSLEGLPDAIREAIVAHAQARMITLQPDARAFVTHSRRLRRSGLLARMTGSGDKDAEHLTAMVIGPRDLFVGTHGKQRRAAVLSTRLEDVGLDTLALAPAGDGMSVSGLTSSVDGAGAGRIVLRRAGRAGRGCRARGADGGGPRREGGLSAGGDASQRRIEGKHGGCGQLRRISRPN